MQEITLKSDLSGEAGAETVEYSINGTNYEVDLTKKERGEFFALLKGYMKVSREVVHVVPVRSAGNERATEIRAWARQNGHTLKDRGRLPQDVVAAFEAANA